MTIMGNGNGGKVLPEGWHLDKKVPITLIITIFLQSAVAIWWIAKVDNRIENLERENSERSTYSDRLVKTEADQYALRVDTNNRLSDMTARLNRIEDKIDRVIEQRTRFPSGRSEP